MLPNNVHLTEAQANYLFKLVRDEEDRAVEVLSSEHLDAEKAVRLEEFLEFLENIKLELLTV